MSTVIKPEVGRVLHFINPEGAPNNCPTSDQPMSAQVSYVWNDNMVNIGGLDRDGKPFNYTSCPLIQPGVEPPQYAYCQWMDYQVGQAQKAEQLQAELDAKNDEPLKNDSGAPVGQSQPPDGGDSPAE